MPKLAKNERYIIYARLKKGEKASDLAEQYGIPKYSLLEMCERIRKAKPRKNSRDGNPEEEKIILGMIQKNPELRTAEIARRTSLKYHRVKYIIGKYGFERVFVGHRCQWIKSS